jgi:predicted GNAT family acetyltransferase
LLYLAGVRVTGRLFHVDEDDNMEIRGEDSPKGGRYVTGDPGQEAQMTFSRASPRLIIIDHTEVPDIYRGQGIGAKLAVHAVEEARKGGWKIIPLCPFFKAQVERHADWQDVISH